MREAPFFLFLDGLLAAAAGKTRLPDQTSNMAGPKDPGKFFFGSSCLLVVCCPVVLGWCVRESVSDE